MYHCTDWVILGNIYAYMSVYSFEYILICTYIGHLTRINENRDHGFVREPRGVWEGLRGRKEKGKRCNYFIVWKAKEKKRCWNTEGLLEGQQGQGGQSQRFHMENSYRKWGCLTHCSVQGETIVSSRIWIAVILREYWSASARSCGAESGKLSKSSGQGWNELLFLPLSLYITDK